MKTIYGLDWYLTTVATYGFYDFIIFHLQCVRAAILITSTLQHLMLSDSFLPVWWVWSGLIIILICVTLISSDIKYFSVWFVATCVSSFVECLFIFSILFIHLQGLFINSQYNTSVGYISCIYLLPVCGFSFHFITNCLLNHSALNNNSIISRALCKSFFHLSFPFPS